MESIRERRFITRVGIGFDAHRFSAPKDGASIMLCGVSVPCEFEIIAHSDGDVALHALTDALLGAIGEGDIGIHFPPSDVRWKNASSDQFVTFALEKILAKGGIINNIDLTIIAETPQIAPHRARLTLRLAEILRISEDAINVKATTTEGMGFTGRKEGIACQAIASTSIKY